MRGFLIGLVTLVIACSFIGPMGAIIGIIVAFVFWLARDPAGKPTSQALAEQPARRGPPLLQLAAPNGACALCMGMARPLFATSRLVVCEKCVWAVRAGAAAEIDELHRQVEIFVRTAMRDQTILEMGTLLKLALDGGFRFRELDKYMVHACDEDWRVCLRAYHFGLLSYPEESYRPGPQAWEALAHEIRVQDGLRCNLCGQRNTAMHVHHILPLSEGGTNDPRNLVTLCHDCHLAQHPGGSFSRPDPLDWAEVGQPQYFDRSTLRS